METITSGSVHQRIGVEARNGTVALIDPDHKIVALHLYDGQLRIASLTEGRLCSFFNLRMDELNILDMCFLTPSHLNTDKPILAVLYEDTRRVRHLKTYILYAEQEELEETVWFQTNLAITADMMIPVHAFGSLLLLGDTCIYYISSSSPFPMNIPVHETTFKCYTIIDDHRYLLSDHMGNLYILILIVSDGIVEDISWQRLGMKMIHYPRAIPPVFRGNKTSGMYVLFRFRHCFHRIQNWGLSTH